MSKNRTLDAGGFDGGFPGDVGEFGGQMDRESDQIERDEDRREVVFPVAEIVFEIVPLRLQGVERLVLDFPPRPSGGGEVLDVVGVDRQIGDEAVAIGDLAVGIADDDFQPIDFECVLAVADGHARHPAPCVSEAIFSALHGLGQRRNFDADQVLVSRLVAVGFADEQKVRAHGPNRLAYGLFRVDVIAQIDRIETAVTGGVQFEPAARARLSQSCLS